MNTNTNMDINLDEVINNPTYMKLMRKIDEQQQELKKIKNENVSICRSREKILKKGQTLIHRNCQTYIKIMNRLKAKNEKLQKKCNTFEEEIKKMKADKKEEEKIIQKKNKEEEKQEIFEKYCRERIIKSEFEIQELLKNYLEKRPGDPIRIGKREVSDDFRFWMDHLELLKVERERMRNIVGLNNRKSHINGLHGFLDKKFGIYKDGWWGYTIKPYNPYNSE